MRRCGARPYKGAEKYIFISYSHKDKARVFPVIERLARDGYRVWYDDGIDPGSEWPTTIARHLKNCEVCIPLISENSLNSANCNQEITYALSKNKKIIAVMLEKVTLPDGLEMQLSVIQSIYKYMQTDEEFFARLYEAAIIRPCLGEPKPMIRVSVPEDYAGDEKDMSLSDFSESGSEKKKGETTAETGWKRAEGEKNGGTAEKTAAGVKNGEVAEKSAAGEGNGGTAAKSAAGEGNGGTAAKSGTAKGRRSYLPPGYRTGDIWHMLVATCYYLICIYITAVGFGTDSLVEGIIFRLLFILMFLGCAAIWGNYLDCWEKIPLMKSKTGRIFGVVLYPCLLLMAVVFVMLLVYMIEGF